MSESIQNLVTGCATVTDGTIRAAFIRRAAELYDRPPAVDPATLDGHTDVAALLLAFPWMHDAELLEALWALGQFGQGGDV
jgi:hypothetical protein